MKLRKSVFWPPFLFLLISVAFSLANGPLFLQTVTSINSWILAKFGWLFNFSSLAMVFTIIGVYFSKLGNVRIGGKDAKPILSKWRWFSITLCTTIAIGILFWASAEPLFHLHAPPVSLGMDSNSNESARFALSTMYMHWTFTPYAIYTVPSLTFALVYYNQKRAFSLTSTLAPLLGSKAPRPTLTSQASLTASAFLHSSQEWQPHSVQVC